MLYQAAVPLMPKGGKFIVVGSRAGVLGMPKTVAAGAYGQSKAAVHFLVSGSNRSKRSENAKEPMIDPTIALGE